MNKRFFLTISFILLSSFYVTHVQADTTGPSFNQQTGELNLPEVVFPDGSVQGPFLLKLNDNNQFELVPGRRSQIQRKFIANKDNIPSLNTQLSELSIPYLCFAGGAESNMCVSLILRINLVRSAYILSVALVNVITANFPVIGRVSSNDQAADYIVMSNSTVNIAPYLFGWCIFMQIQNFPSHFGEGTLLGYMPRSFTTAEYIFAALGKVGILYAFAGAGAEVETTSNGNAKFIINSKGDLEILISGQHTQGQLWQANLAVAETVGAFYLSLLVLYYLQIAQNV